MSIGTFSLHGIEDAFSSIPATNFDSPPSLAFQVLQHGRGYTIRGQDLLDHSLGRLSLQNHDMLIPSNPSPFHQSQTIFLNSIKTTATLSLSPTPSHNRPNHHSIEHNLAFGKELANTPGRTAKMDLCTSPPCSSDASNFS